MSVKWNSGCNFQDGHVHTLMPTITVVSRDLSYCTKVQVAFIPVIVSIIAILWNKREQKIVKILYFTPGDTFGWGVQSEKTTEMPLNWTKFPRMHSDFLIREGYRKRSLGCNFLHGSCRNGIRVYSRCNDCRTSKALGLPQKNPAESFP